MRHPNRREFTMKTLSAFLLLILALNCVAVQATEPASNESDQTAERKAASLKLAGDEVKRFAFYFTDAPDKEFELHSSPVVRYGNYNAESYSNAFIWTNNGRPEAIASVTNWYRPREYYGLAVTSLATKPLTGERDDQEIWRPRNAGVEFRPIPDAGVPGELPVQRLREMRALAREFRADFKRVARYLESGKLRLMSTPLYRYESVESGVADGAIFGLALGTAPQLVLLIEARKSVGELRWEYAVAPRNSMEYQVWHKDRQVWSLPQLAPPWPNSKIPTNTYAVFPDLQKEGRTEELVRKLRAETSTGEQAK